ncbi:unnamed protein product [Amaranthus hypochondriacus]
MGSKGRLPPHHIRHPVHGPGLVHPEPFGAGIRPPHDGFLHNEMLPPLEILEKKLATQHAEMERLATENQRLAGTHGSLRQQLAAAQEDLRMMDSQIRVSKSEREQQIRALMEKNSKMEAELQAGNRLKLELHHARAEAQSLVEVRQELISKVQQLNNELQRAHVDVQQIPTMMSELDHLRQEFHKYKATFEHERKVYRDHLESLQAMDKEYRSMADEVAKLRAELSNPANVDKRPAYSSGAGYRDASTHNSSVHSSYEESFGVPQAHQTFPSSTAAGGPASAATAGGGVVASSGGTPTYSAPQTGPAYSGYEAQRAQAYNPQGGQVYNPQRASGYDGYRGVYDMPRPPYDPQRAAYDPQRAAYDPQRAAYDPQRAAYEMPRGATAPLQGQAPTNNVPYGSAAPPPANNVPYGSAAPPPANTVPYGSAAPPVATQTAAGHETQPRGDHSTRR